MTTAYVVLPQSEDQIDKCLGIEDLCDAAIFYSLDAAREFLNKETQARALPCRICEVQLSLFEDLPALSATL